MSMICKSNKKNLNLQIKLHKLEEFNSFLNNDLTLATKMPRQDIPSSKKNDKYVKRTVDFLYTDARKQLSKNRVFRDIAKMVEGTFSYRAVDIERTLSDTPHEDIYKNLKKDVPISTHLKHFDFIGIIVNAIKSVFGDLDDLYRLESTDEYAINEMLRLKTEKLHEYGAALVQAEVAKKLIKAGFNPDKQDFKSEEEAQQYQQQLDEATKKLTPEEIEKELATNFKVIAVDWANNVLVKDKKDFDLAMADRRALTDYLLTGRWFRHYKVGYDYYDIEYWSPEDVFFSEDADIRYPQEADWIGTLVRMSASKAIEKYGHLMTTKQQKQVNNWWRQDEDENINSGRGSNIGLPFAEAHILPFSNYYEHKVNTQMEQALGVPLAQSMDKETGEVTRHWMPQPSFNFSSYGGATNDKWKREDIDVRTDTIEVMDVYWKSMKEIYFLIFRDDVGALKLSVVTDELLPEFIEENEIKVKSSISPIELQDAIYNGNLEEYENTLTKHYVPDFWHAVVLKGSEGCILTDDMILDAKPFEFQIRGNSAHYQVCPPVAGSIGVGIAPKIFPYQQLHNICLNQITELLADEPGTFYSIDINSLPSKYKDEDTEQSLYEVMNTIKTTKLLPLDPSKTNMEGSAVYPNIFQRNEVVFRDQILYRRDMAEYFKQQAYQQIGITPQLLGQAINAETAEGVKQQATATYALISNIIDDFNSSKAKSTEIHIAIAQQCEVRGISRNRLIQNSDASNHFIDILAEDPEYFQFRKISAFAAANSADRNKVSQIQNLLMSDNTLQKEFVDVVDIFTKPSTLKLREIGRQMQEKTKQATQEQRAFEDSQLTKQLEAADKKVLADREHEKEMENIKGGWRFRESYLISLGRDSSSTKTNDFDELKQAFESTLKMETNTADLALKERDIIRKEQHDYESRKMENRKIEQKDKELALRDKKIITDDIISIRNKN